MDEKVKISAAISAVVAYIEEEEATMMMAQPVEEAAPAPAAPVGMYGISGRQTQMQLRNLMQLKAFHGSGPR